MKTSKLEAKPSENSNKRKKKNFLSKTFTNRSLSNSSTSRGCIRFLFSSYRNKRMEETKTRDRA